MGKLEELSEALTKAEFDNVATEIFEKGIEISGFIYKKQEKKQWADDPKRFK